MTTCGYMYMQSAHGSGSGRGSGRVGVVLSKSVESVFGFCSELHRLAKA